MKKRLPGFLYVHEILSFAPNPHLHCGENDGIGCSKFAPRWFLFEYAMDLDSREVDAIDSREGTEGDKGKLLRSMRGECRLRSGLFFSLLSQGRESSSVKNARQGTPD